VKQVSVLSIQHYLRDECDLLLPVQITSNRHLYHVGINMFTNFKVFIFTAKIMSALNLVMLMSGFLDHIS